MTHPARAALVLSRQRRLVRTQLALAVALPLAGCLLGLPVSQSAMLRAVSDVAVEARAVVERDRRGDEAAQEQAFLDDPPREEVPHGPRQRPQVLAAQCGKALNFATADLPLREAPRPRYTVPTCHASASTWRRGPPTQGNNASCCTSALFPLLLEKAPFSGAMSVS